METPVSLMIVLLAVPTGFLSFVLVSLRYRRRQSLLLFAQGIEYVKILRSLLTYIQQHRGLTTGYINGNLAAKVEIETLENTIKRTMAAVGDAGEWMHSNVKWSSLVDHWSRLSLLYSQGDADKNFKQHNMLIANYST